MNEIRRKYRRDVAGILILLGSLCACATSLDRMEHRPPRELVLSSVEAYGGSEAVLDFEDMSYECNIAIRADRGWVSGETDLRFRNPDRLYSSLRLDSGVEKTQSFDGRQAEERINGKTTGRNITADIGRRRRITLIHAFLLEEGEEAVELSGRGNADGVHCAILEKKAGEETWKVWIDLNRYLIRKIRLVLPPGDTASGVTGPLSVEWRFNEFREVDGRQVPHVFKQFLNGELFQQGRITRFRLNSGLKPKDFKPPS